MAYPALLIDPLYILEPQAWLEVQESLQPPGCWQFWSPQKDFHTRLRGEGLFAFVWQAGKNYHQLGKEEEFISTVPCDSGLMALIPCPLLEQRDYKPQGVMLSFAALPSFRNHQLSWEYQLFA